MHDLSDDSNEQGSSTEEENQTGDDTELKERYILFLQYLNEQIKFYILESQISQNNLGMPSKKKKSVWRDIVPTRGGGGKNKLQNVPT